MSDWFENMVKAEDDFNRTHWRDNAERLKKMDNEKNRLAKINILQSWAINKLSILCEHTNRDYAEQEKEKIIKELQEEIGKVNQRHKIG